MQSTMAPRFGTRTGSYSLYGPDGITVRPGCRNGYLVLGPDVFGITVRASYRS